MQVLRVSHGRRALQKGFTLVELVAVMVIIGIISVGSTMFIGQAVTGVSDTAERQQVSSIAWIISEKLSRDLRRALPNSVRIASANGLSNNCIEFVPTVDGTYYRDIPTGIAGTTAEVINFGSYTAGAMTSRDRLSVFPNDNIDSYTLANPGPVSTQITSIVAGALAGTTELTFSSPFAFQSASPQNRVYVVRDPVAYCFSTSVLRRYNDYGYESAFNFSALSNGAVIATGMQFGRFDFDASSASTSATVSVQTRFLMSSGTHVDFEQEVQVRNVP